MRKVLFVLSVVFLLCLLMGCGQEYTLIVENQSTREVKFTMTIGYADHKLTLPPGNKYIHPNPIPEVLKSKEKIITYEPKKNVEWSCSGDVYTFTDVK